LSGRCISTACLLGRCPRGDSKPSQRRGYVYVEVLCQSLRSSGVSAHGPERRGVVRVRDRRGLCRRRSCPCVRSWRKRGCREGADWSDRSDPWGCHCRRWCLTPGGGHSTVPPPPVFRGIYFMNWILATASFLEILLLLYVAVIDIATRLI